MVSSLQQAWQEVNSDVMHTMIAAAPLWEVTGSCTMAAVLLGPSKGIHLHHVRWRLVSTLPKYYVRQAL